MKKLILVPLLLSGCNIRAVAMLETSDAVYSSSTISHKQSYKPYNAANDNLLGVTTALPPFTANHPDYPPIPIHLTLQHIETQPEPLPPAESKRYQCRPKVQSKRVRKATKSETKCIITENGVRKEGVRVKAGTCCPNITVDTTSIDPYK